MDDMKRTDSDAGLKVPALGRRDLMKMGVSAGVAMAMPAAAEAAAQEAAATRGRGAAAADGTSRETGGGGGLPRVACKQRRIEAFSNGPIS